MRRPLVTSAQLAAAVERITARRTGARDPDLHRLGEHPEEVVAHVHRYRRVPAAVVRADVVDAWLVCDALDQMVDRHRLRLLYAARDTGVTLADLAETLGVSGPTGVLEAIRRLEAAAGGGPKDAAAVYARRRDAAAEQARARRQAEAVRECARALVGVEDRLPGDLAGDLAEIRAVVARAAAGEDVDQLLAARLRILLHDIGDASLCGEAAGAVERAAAVLRCPGVG